MSEDDLFIRGNIFLSKSLYLAKKSFSQKVRDLLTECLRHPHGMFETKHSQENDKSLPQLISHSVLFSGSSMSENDKYSQIKSCLGTICSQQPFSHLVRHQSVAVKYPKQQKSASGSSMSCPNKKSNLTTKIQEKQSFSGKWINLIYRVFKGYFDLF